MNACALEALKDAAIRGGYKWIPKFNSSLPLSPAPGLPLSITAVIVTPMLTFGGAEQWVRQLATQCDPSRIQWRVVLTGNGWCQPVVDAIQKVSPIYCVNHAVPGVPSFPDARAAITAAADGADILVTWGHPQFWPLDLEIPIVVCSQADHWYFQEMNEAAWGHATHYVGVSQATVDHTMRPEMKGVSIWNAADQDRVKVTRARKDVHRSYGIPDDWWYKEKVIIGTLARLAPEKNHGSAIRAVAQLPGHFELVLVGSGSTAGAPDYDKQIIDLGRLVLANRFHHLPAVDDVGNHLNAFDVFLTTSNYEGSSLALAEAMLAGVPIVTTKVGAVPEFEAAAGQPLFWVVPQHATTHEVAVAIREAYLAGRDSDRVKAAKAFAEKHLTTKAMTNKWTDYLIESVREHRSVVRESVVLSPPLHYAYVTGTNRPQDCVYMETMIKSARAVGVQEDFHCFAPRQIQGGISHTEPFRFDKYMFKLDLMLRLKDSDYDFLIFVDPDNYFVRHPGDMGELIRDEKLWVSMEGDLTLPGARTNWWGIGERGPSCVDVMRSFGITRKEVWNTNAGMFMIRRDAIEEVVAECRRVFNDLINRGYKDCTEEPPLAILGQTIVREPERNQFLKHSHVWASDWIKAATEGNKLPNGKPFKYIDWATNKTLAPVNPAIIHVMGNKHLMGQSGQPVGTKLAEILTECGVQRPANCDCNKWTGLMNQGVEWCKANRQQIAGHLNHAAHQAGWLTMAKVAARGYLSIDSLIDEAIKRATKA